MSSSIKRAWLAPDFLNWYVYSEGGSVGEITSEMFSIPHTYVDHASKLLTSNPSELNRADAINNLKKALYHRVETLNELYQLDKFSYLKLPKNRFKRLESLNLLKPIMSEHLAEVRADIEHNHIAPPLVERCSELAEYVWYFLKSTDPFIRMIKDSIVFNADGIGYEGGHEVSFIYPQIPEKSRGFIAQLPKEQFSLEKEDEWLEVEVEKITTESEMIEKQKTTTLPLKHAPNETDLHIRGIIIGPVEKLIALRQRYFEVY